MRKITGGFLVFGYLFLSLTIGAAIWRAVVGAGASSENDEEKQILSPIETVADNSGRIMKSRKISAFPTWIINDSTGKEIFRQAGSPQLSSDDQVPLLFSQFFKI